MGEADVIATLAKVHEEHTLVHTSYNLVTQQLTNICSACGPILRTNWPIHLAELGAQALEEAMLANTIWRQ